MLMKSLQVLLQSVSYSVIFSQSDQCDSLVLASRYALVLTNKLNLPLRHFQHIVDALEELRIWPRCTPAFAVTLLRVKQEFRARTMLCAAGSIMDVKHPGYVTGFLENLGIS